MQRRRRFKQTLSFKDRLLAFAEDIRSQAALLPAGHERDDMLTRARRADTAWRLDDWANSPRLQTPK
jgi:hypothetical protein